MAANNATPAKLARRLFLLSLRGQPTLAVSPQLALEHAIRQEHGRAKSHDRRSREQEAEPRAQIHATRRAGAEQRRQDARATELDVVANRAGCDPVAAVDGHDCVLHCRFRAAARVDHVAERGALMRAVHVEVGAGLVLVHAVLERVLLRTVDRDRGHVRVATRRTRRFALERDRRVERDLSRARRAGAAGARAGLLQRRSNEEDELDNALGHHLGCLKPKEAGGGG